MKNLFLFRLALLIPIFVGLSSSLYGQTTITEWTYEPLQGLPGTPNPNSGNGSSLVVGVGITAGTGTGMDTPTGCGTQTSNTNAWSLNPFNTGATESTLLPNETQGAQWNVSTVGFEDVIVQWEQRWSGASANTIRFQYTINGSTWNNFDMTASNTTFCLGSLNNGRFETNTTGDRYRRITVDLSDIAGVENNPDFGFRVVAAHFQNTGEYRRVTNTSLIALAGTWRFDNVRVAGTALPPPTDPTVTLNANLLPFDYIFGDGPSAVQDFTVSGINLTDDIVVSVSANFEVALAEAGPYQTAPINLEPVAGDVAETTIYVRLQAGLSSGLYPGDITVVSEDDNSPQTVALEGQVVSETLPYLEDFGIVAGLFPIGWTTSGPGADNWAISLASQSFDVGSAGANLADAGANIVGQEAIVTCNRAISTQGHDLVRVTFLARKTNAYSGNVLFDYSTDGVTWNNVPFTDVPNDGEWGLVFFVLPNDAANVDNLRVRFRTTRSNTSGNYRIDDFAILPPGLQVNLSASAAIGNEDDETEITITATTAEPVDNEETILLGVTGVRVNEKDYEISAPEIIIPAGETSASVTFKILNDNLNEGTEVATVGINSVSFDLQIGNSGSVDITIIDAAEHDAVYLSQINVAHPTITFDELQNSGTNLFDLTAGFYMFEQGSNSNEVYRASDGSSSTGDTYSFGAVGSEERALGSITTGPLDPNTFGAKVVNTTGQLMHGLTVAYIGEQWRSGNATFDELRFAYSTDATGLDNGTWIEVEDLHFVAPHNGGGGAALDGNDANNQIEFNVNIFGINLPAGQEMWIRWVDIDVPSSDHGMGVDDLILTPFVSSQLQAGSCGATDVAPNQLLFATNVNAPQYRFRFTGDNNGGPGWNNDQFIVDRPHRYVYFNHLVPGFQFGETYSVEVAVGDGNGNFGPYGAACDVTLVSPAAAPLSQIQTSQCGSTVDGNNLIFANQIFDAQGYRFKITGPNNGGAGWNNDEFILDRPNRNFYFSWLVPGATPGATFSVEVAYLMNDGVTYSPYGAACDITLNPQTTQIQASQCGATGVMPNALVFANQVFDAQGYRFRITGSNSGAAGWNDDVFILDRPNRNFNFQWGVPGSLPGETYEVEVAFLQNDGVTYSAYGAMCEITLFGAAEFVLDEDNDIFIDNKSMISVEFGANASHNPFTTDFGLQVLNANDTETINVNVYDMSGKLIERNAVNAMDIETVRFGANLAAGMYMIEVRQGSNQAVIRQVKN